MLNFWPVSRLTVNTIETCNSILYLTSNPMNNLIRYRGEGWFIPRLCSVCSVMQFVYCELLWSSSEEYGCLLPLPKSLIGECTCSTGVNPGDSRSLEGCRNPAKIAIHQQQINFRTVLTQTIILNQILTHTLGVKLYTISYVLSKR